MRNFQSGIVVIAPVLFFLTWPTMANAQSCLERLEDFATRICGEVVTLSEQTDRKVEGAIDAGVEGIVKRLIGSFSIRGSVTDTQTTVVNVARDHMHTDRVDARLCRRDVIEKAGSIACPPAFLTCAHPDFGRAGWRYSEEYERSSGFGPGASQAHWCSEVVNEFVRTRGIGVEYESVVIRSGENHKKDIFGHVTYRYDCRVRISWDPIYNERADARCGLEQ